MVSPEQSPTQPSQFPPPRGPGDWRAKGRMSLGTKAAIVICALGLSLTLVFLFREEIEAYCEARRARHLADIVYVTPDGSVTAPAPPGVEPGARYMLGAETPLCPKEGGPADPQAWGVKMLPCGYLIQVLSVETVGGIPWYEVHAWKLTALGDDEYSYDAGEFRAGWISGASLQQPPILMKRSIVIRGWTMGLLELPVFTRAQRSRTQRRS